MKNRTVRSLMIALCVPILLVEIASAQTDATVEGVGPETTAANLKTEIATLRGKIQHLEQQLSVPDNHMAAGANLPARGGKRMMEKDTMSGMSGMGMAGPGGLGPMDRGSRSAMAGGGTRGMDMSMSAGMSARAQGGMSMGGTMPSEGVAAGMGCQGCMGMMGGGNMNGMSASGTDSSSGMGMMDMMGEMGGMSTVAMQSSSPGIPGASHLHHIGATGFFLDHADHIRLSTAQHTQLNQIRQQASLENATANRKIEEAEQQLWGLTAAEQPDYGSIEAKIRELEKLRGDQRLAFVRAIGDAINVLTHDQHKLLMGTETGSAPPDDSAGTH